MELKISSKIYWNFQVNMFMKIVESFRCYQQTQANRTVWPLRNRIQRNQKGKKGKANQTCACGFIFCFPSNLSEPNLGPHWWTNEMSYNMIRNLLTDGKAIKESNHCKWLFCRD